MSATLPTREQVAAILAAHKGQGRAAMRDAVTAMKESFPDMTDFHVDMILNDLLSYSDYVNEP